MLRMSGSIPLLPIHLKRRGKKTFTLLPLSYIILFLPDIDIRRSNTIEVVYNFIPKVSIVLNTHVLSVWVRENCCKVKNVTNIIYILSHTIWCITRLEGMKFIKSNMFTFFIVICMSLRLMQYDTNQLCCWEKTFLWMCSTNLLFLNLINILQIFGWRKSFPHWNQMDSVFII